MNLLIKGAVGVCLVLPVSIAVREGAFDGMLLGVASNPYFAFTGWGALALFLWTRPGMRDCIATGIIALIWRLAYDLFSGRHGHYFGATLLENGIFLANASIVVLAFRVIQLRGAARSARWNTLRVSVVLSYLYLGVSLFLTLATLMRPLKYDLFLFAFDQTLGFQSSFLLGKLSASSPFLGNLQMTVYYAASLAVPLFYGIHVNAKNRWPVNPLKIILVNCVAGFLLYLILPACGPKYAFPGAYPDQIPTVTHLQTIPLSYPPNSMPSLHFATALLIFWNVRPWVWARRLAGAFLILTVFATLGTGEHYLVDLVVAFPYAVAIQAACAHTRVQRRPLFIGAALYGLWIILLRFGLGIFIHPAISWCFVLSTIAVSLYSARIAGPIPADEPVLVPHYRGAVNDPSLIYERAAEPTKVTWSY